MTVPRYSPPACNHDELRRRFRRGRNKPKAVVWFGLRAFWGHLFHFVASAIATEDIDSRDWMRPERPDDLAAQIVRRLRGTHYRGNLLDSLDRELWIDYVADTGDDADVSRRVADLLFAEYDLPDPDDPEATLIAPRGEILIFGGDTAYPVATVDEVFARVVEPFNAVLKERNDGRQRVLLGVPGNHDWYDGLAGFASLFRGKEPSLERAMATRSVTLQHHTVNYYAGWAKKFVQGEQVYKPKALNLVGYEPFQQASYFALPLSQHLQLFGIDRQLREMDLRQREFFNDLQQRHAQKFSWLLLPDPVFAFGEPSVSGTAMARALGARFEERAYFVLAGDIHHYRRTEHGPSLHVTAGGGGAFLHPGPAARNTSFPAVIQWPGSRQSRALLRAVPWRAALGKSGLIPHLAFLAVVLPPLLLGRWLVDETVGYLAPVALSSVAVAITYSLIGGAGRGRGWSVWPLASVAGLLTGAAPWALWKVLGWLLVTGNMELNMTWQLVIVLLAGSVFGAFVFGAYLVILTLLGLENTQAFTALGHPGYKHFMRFRLRRDGRTLDAWCIGLADPLAEDSKPVIVDRFSWRC